MLRTKQYLFRTVSIVLLLLLLSGLAFIGIKTELSGEKSLPITVLLKGENGEQKITAVKSNDQKWYFYLPSFSEFSKLSLVSSSDGVTFNGKSLKRPLKLSDFALDTDYQVIEKGVFSSKKETAVFVKSSNVATVFVKSPKGSLKNVFEDKNKKESVMLNIFDENGKLDYKGNGADKIKGRGNSTWGLEKKPFNLYFFENTSVLGMKKGASLTLLANGFDETNLRNKTVLGFAKKAGLGWSPDCRFADLYLDGEYVGLYLLTERVEVAENRVSLNNEKSDFLFETALEARAKDKKDTIATDNNRYFTIDYPKKFTDKEKDRIKDTVNSFETEILSGNLKRVDLNSFARRFLTDEIFGNTDTDAASSFYRYDSKKNLFYAGPVWDYDLSMGNTAYMSALKSRDPEQIYSTCTSSNSFVKALYDCKEFKEKVIEIYKTEFLPLINELTQKELPKYENEIKTASKLNSLRWNTLFDGVYENRLSFEEQTESLTDFLDKKTAFLNKVWLSGEDYVSVSFYENDKFNSIKSVTVKSGEPVLGTDKIHINGNVVWRNLKTDEIVDFSVFRPYENISLYADVSSSSNGGITALISDIKLEIFFVFIFAVIFAVLIIFEIKNRKKGEKNGRA